MCIGFHGSLLLLFCYSNSYTVRVCPFDTLVVYVADGQTRAALERLVMYYRMLDRPEKAAEYESLYATATH
jgi:hypothetical protein